MATLSVGASSSHPILEEEEEEEKEEEEDSEGIVDVLDSSEKLELFN